MYFINRLLLLVLASFILPYLYQARAMEFDYGEPEAEEEVIVPFKHPKRKVSIIVTETGYYPEQIVAYKGEKITFYITSTVPEPSCLILSGHELFLSAEKGKLVTGEIELKSSGDFSFYCPSQKFKGNLLVLKNKEKRQAKRTLASKKPNVWMPKEK